MGEEWVMTCSMFLSRDSGSVDRRPTFRSLLQHFSGIIFTRMNKFSWEFQATKKGYKYVVSLF